MSVRNELETLLSISQGATEDYQEYLLRMLEEANNAFNVSEASEAKGEDLYSKLTQKTKDWFNVGVGIYNGSVITDSNGNKIIRGDCIIPDFPKAVQPVHESILEQVYSSEIGVKTQENIGNIEDIIPDVVSLPEIETETQESINTELALPEQTSEVEIDYQFTPDAIPEKKKRGRPKGTKNKTKDTQLVVEDFTERVMDRETIEEHSEEETGDSASATVIEATENKYPLSVQTEEEISIYEETLTAIEDITNNPTKYGLKELCTTKPQKPLDLFRILVCQNHDRPFEEIFKLVENYSIDIKRPTALVTCSQIKATINTLKNLWMLKENIC